MINLITLEQKLEQFVLKNMEFDPAHDIHHIKRVVKLAKSLAKQEQADPYVVVPSAWLHDCVNVSKDSPDRNKGSLFSADKALLILQKMSYPEKYFDNIHHTIHAHSFSANVPTETLEAMVLQDADRLDAIGALGIARCLRFGAIKGAAIYHPDEPIAQTRELDEKQYSIDHFYTKLFKLEETMKTSAGTAVAHQRTQYMRGFVEQLVSEL